MPHFTKPAEGSWTEHFGLGTEPVSYEDSISSAHYELERDAIFRRTWLNVGRVEQPADDALEIGEDTGRALPGLGLHFEAAEKLALPAEETAAQLAPAEVDADGTPIGGHEQSRDGDRRSDRQTAGQW